MARPSKISPDQIHTILQLHKDGNSLRQIQKLTKDYSLGTLSKIISSQALTPEQIELKRFKKEATKRMAEVKANAMDTITTTNTFQKKEDAKSSAFTEEYLKTKEEMKRLLSLANTNHKECVNMVSKILAKMDDRLDKYGDDLNIADNKRVMEIVDLGVDVMAKLFNTLGFDIRNELIQLSMRKAEEKNTPILQVVNSDGKIVDIYQKDHVTKKLIN